MTKVVLQTDWYPQPEHGGFYTALVNGSYEEEGLDVTIQPGSQYSLALPPLPPAGAGADVVAYLAGDAQPYRRVHVGGAGPAQ